MEIRFAEPRDMGGLSELVKTGYDIQWTEADLPWWMIIDDKGAIMAAVQICPQRPVGRLELMHIREGVGLRLRAALVKTLTAAGLQALRAVGCQVAVCFVAQHDNGFKRMLKRKLGAETVNHGNLLAVRFA